MIRSLMDMLVIAKKEKLRGKYINVALGKNKIPESFKDVFKLTLLRKWQKK